MQSKFIKSATELSQCPMDSTKEVVFLGRSNAGKSSLINSLLKRKNLAKVSSTPGKTRLLNFFLVNNSYRFVDLPGYGFASRSKKEQEFWQKFIEEFLTKRRNIAGFILVMDVRRKWSEDEESLYNFVTDLQIPSCLALTKVDKLNKKETSAAKKRFNLEIPEWELFFLSNLKGTGVSDFHQYLFKTWRLSEKIATKPEDD